MSLNKFEFKEIKELNKEFLKVCNASKLLEEILIARSQSGSTVYCELQKNIENFSISYIKECCYADPPTEYIFATETDDFAVFAVDVGEGIKLIVKLFPIKEMIRMPIQEI